MRHVLLAVSSVAFLLAAPAPDPAMVVGRTQQATHWRSNRNEPIFVAVIGSDVREGNPFAGRGDSIHIVGWNPQAGAGSIVGIPRDTVATYANGGAGKINNALMGGGDNMAATITNLSGIPIHYWVVIEFARFRDLINRIGGMTVEVPYRIVEPKSGARFDAGPVPMDGAAALAFARVRYGIPEGDIGRSGNQGRILLSALGKYKDETKDPMRLGHWLAAYRELSISNVPLRELLDLAALGHQMDPSKMSNAVVRGGFGTLGGASVIHLGPEAQAIFANMRDDAILN